MGAAVRGIEGRVRPIVAILADVESAGSSHARQRIGDDSLTILIVGHRVVDRTGVERRRHVVDPWQEVGTYPSTGRPEQRRRNIVAGSHPCDVRIIRCIVDAGGRCQLVAL